MSAKLEKLLNVAKKTKTALYSEWDKKRFFEDCNYFYDRGHGILSEAMGLTSVMLLLVRFSENPEVFENGKCDSKTIDIITTSLNFIYNAAFDKGYTVEPLQSAENTKGIIDKEISYVDTLTWVLSASILITYSIRKEILEIDESIEQKAIELMSDALARLLNGQLDCGAWGFSTDKNCKRSLYSTYAAGASIADFLDYILGELEYYDDDENQKKELKKFYDKQTINEINNFYRNNSNPIYPKIDVAEAVLAAKRKLQEWLIKDCLPLLPKIAQCEPLSDKEMDIVGVYEQTTPDQIKRLGNKDYINLYYTFYIIDILTTSSSDKRYPQIINGNDSFAFSDLKVAYKNILSSSDYNYYFERNNGANAITLFNEFINQAIHSSRMNFSIAKRTGKVFWENDNNASELNIKWEHENLTSDRIDDARGDACFTEPTLVPMALRANAVYCFYIIEKSDVMVDILFNHICNDQSDITETVRRDTRIKDLWDRKNYSLPITERSIEALVDYYDYIEKFDFFESSIVAKNRILSMDETVDLKIESFIRSDKGKKIIDSQNNNTNSIDESLVERIVNEKINTILSNSLNIAIEEKMMEHRRNTFNSVTSEIDIEGILSISDILTRRLNDAQQSLNKNSQDDYERLAAALIQLFMALQEKSILELVENEVADDDTPCDVAKNISKNINNLIKQMVRYNNNVAGDLAEIYKRLTIN